MSVQLNHTIVWCRDQPTRTAVTARMTAIATGATIAPMTAIDIRVCTSIRLQCGDEIFAIFSAVIPGFMPRLSGSGAILRLSSPWERDRVRGALSRKSLGTVPLTRRFAPTSPQGEVAERVSSLRIPTYTRNRCAAGISHEHRHAEPDSRGLVPGSRGTHAAVGLTMLDVPCPFRK